MSYTSSGRSPLSVVLAVLWLLSSVNGVAAKAVCHTDAQGNEQCKQMLSTGVIVAIVVSGVVFFALCFGVFFYIRRTRARKEAAAIEATFTVEATQIRGPPVMARAHTTYDKPSLSYSRGLMSGSGYYASGSGNYASGSGNFTSGSDITTVPSKRLAALQAAGGAPVIPPLDLGGPSSAPMSQPYPFTGISSSKLPPMPQPASAYVRTGPAFGYSYV